MALERTDQKASRRARVVRRVLLAGVLIAMTGIAYAHQTIPGAGKPPGVDALCPFGGLETLFTLLSGQGFIKRTAASSVILLVGMVGVALVWRRSFCGQLCPLGALQGAFGWLGRRLRVRHALPASLDRPARNLKYAVLAVFTVWTWQAASLVMRPYDPWVAWTHIASTELMTSFGIGAVVLGLSLAGSIFFERFFCKYLCPTGALLGLLSKVSLTRIERSAGVCIECGACDRACPMDVPVSGAGVVTDSECISCAECVTACAVRGALEVTAAFKRLAPLTMTGIVAGIVAALIVATTVTGLFSWRMPTLAEAIEQHGGAPGKATTGTFDVALIRGYMSMSEIAEATGIQACEFSETFGVPEADLSRPMKEIKDRYGFTPEDVRAWVAERSAR